MAVTETNPGLLDYEGDDPSSFATVVVSDDELLISPPTSSWRHKIFAFVCNVILAFIAIAIGVDYFRDGKRPGVAEVGIGAGFILMALYWLAWNVNMFRYWRRHGSTRPTYTLRPDAVIENAPGLWRRRPRQWNIEGGRTVRWTALPDAPANGWNFHVWIEPVDNHSLMFNVPVRRRSDVDNLGAALTRLYRPGVTQ